MKEKYFPREGFFDAQLGRRPSYVWRSLIKAKSILQNGVGWKVGNGENIRIWEDARLSSPHGRLFLPNRLGWPSDAQVSSLIDTNSGWWNLDLIQQIFNPKEVAQIGRVLLSPLKQPTKIIWRGTPSGIFTVRSAYHLEMRRTQERG
jgi:hypothetical protein